MNIDVDDDDYSSDNYLTIFNYFFKFFSSIVNERYDSLLGERLGEKRVRSLSGCLSF